MNEVHLPEEIQSSELCHSVISKLCASVFGRDHGGSGKVGGGEGRPRPQGR